MKNPDTIRFAESIAASPELQASVEAIFAAARQTTAEKLAALAGQIGIPLAAEDALSLIDGSELSESQLDSLAGGGRDKWNIWGLPRLG